MTTKETVEKFFKDFSPEMPAITTVERKVTQSDIDAFATLTWDTNPLHLDREFATKSFFKGIVAHGMFCESLAGGLAWQAGLIQRANAIFRHRSWEDVREVRPGDTLFAVISVSKTETARKGPGGFVTFSVTLKKKGGRDKTAGTGTWVIYISDPPTAEDEAAEGPSGSYALGQDTPHGNVY